MKRFFILMFLTLTVLFAQDRAFTSILKNVSIIDVDEAINSAKNLKKDLTKKNFTSLVNSWKKVETLYFAGDLNEDYLDTPRYIDVFHNLKENLSLQMKRVINSKDEANIALFKNSFKTINALEYVLFNDEKISLREKELSKVILDSIISNLEGIKEVYSTYLKEGIKSQKWENALILNTLISSTYKLKEWRVGDPAGLSSKYKNEAKNDRAEYFLSKNSFNAINSILEAHTQVVGETSYYNFASMAKQSEAKKEIIEVQKSIKEAKEELKKLKNDDFESAEALYRSLVKLHNSYYLSLTTQLSVTAKILDADGD